MSLDSNNAHGSDMMSIRMLKICGDLQILTIYLQVLLRVRVLPQNWEKANVVSTHKK